MKSPLARPKNHTHNRYGPQTEEGRERIRRARWVHGERSAAGIEEAARMTAYIRQCEDALRVLGAIQGPKQPGRKPSLYAPIETLAEVRTFVVRLIAGGKTGGIV